MKTVQIILSLAFITSLFYFGCQSDKSKSDISLIENTQPFYLDIDLPNTPIDNLLKSTKERPEIDIYLKTNTDSLGKSKYILSINKQVVSFDVFNELFDSLRFAIDKGQRNKTVANLYIDKSTPFYLVDYLHKRLYAFHQYRVNYPNKKGQYFSHRISEDQRLWSIEREYSIESNPYPLPPPPLTLPSRNPESDSTVFSQKYLSILNIFGIGQEPVSYNGPIHCLFEIQKNILEIKLNEKNKVSIDDKVIKLSTVIKAWEVFMSDERLWRKKITYIVVSGEADYEHYFELYSAVLSAFQQKLNRLALDMFDKNLNELPRDQKKEVYGKLPRIIIPELGD